VIDDLDRTIEALLRHELPASLANVAITFATPDDEFPPQSVTPPAIDVFLYDIRENRELRSNEWLLERRSDGTAAKEPPPLRIECSYLVTAWASESTPTPAQDEHKLLGEAMRALVRYSTLPDELLQGELAGQEPPLPATAIQPGHLQSMAEFWQALGGKPRAAFTYSVTIGMSPVDAAEAGPLVREKVLQLKQIDGSSSS
jgi:hypothetical protein